MDTRPEYLYDLIVRSKVFSMLNEGSVFIFCSCKSWYENFTRFMPSECMEKSYRNALFIARITRFSKLQSQNDSKLFPAFLRLVFHYVTSFLQCFEKTFTKNKFPEVVILLYFSKSGDQLPLVFCTHTLLRLRSNHFETFDVWCVLYCAWNVIS